MKWLGACSVPCGKRYKRLAMLTVATAAATGCRYNAAGNKADVESSSRGILDN